MTDFLGALREELLDGLERHERAPWWQGAPAARRAAAVAVAAAAAVAVAVGLAERAPEIERGAAPEVSRLEGFHATGLAVADGDLWVSQYDIAAVLRIDLPAGEVEARIDVGGSPAAVIAGADAVWVHDWERGRVLKLDPDANRVVETLAAGTTNSDIAFAGGAVWAIGERGELLRVDPRTAAVTERVSLGRGAPLPTEPPSGATLAAAGDTLWVIAADGRVTEVDASTADIRGRARGPALPIEKSRRAAADASGLWISSPARREVVHIAARTRRVSRHPVPGDPGPLAIVDGRIWVGTLHDTGAMTQVTVLDGDGRIAATVPVPQLAVNIAAAPDGGAWISFGENATVSPAALHVRAP